MKIILPLLFRYVKIYAMVLIPYHKHDLPFLSAKVQQKWETAKYRQLN